jgi:hypothetical protein
MECNERRSAVSKAVATQTVQILNVTDKWAQSIHLAAKSSLSGAILGTHHKHLFGQTITLMCHERITTSTFTTNITTTCN